MVRWTRRLAVEENRLTNQRGTARIFLALVAVCILVFAIGATVSIIGSGDVQGLTSSPSATSVIPAVVPGSSGSGLAAEQLLTEVDGDLAASNANLAKASTDMQDSSGR